MIFTGKKPIYIEIKEYFTHLIDTNAFKDGDSIPSVRDFALSNRINPNTVARAYDLLVQEGKIISIPKKGYFVKKDKEMHEIDVSKLKLALDNLLNEGYTKEDIIKVLEEKEDKK